MEKKDVHLLLSSLESYFNVALLSYDLWSNKDIKSIVGAQNGLNISNNFGSLIEKFKIKFENLGLPLLGNYIIYDLDMDSLLLFINFDGEYTLGILIDKSILNFDTLFKVVIPELVTSYKTISL